MINQGILFN